MDIKYNIMMYSFLFVTFTTLAFFARGKDAFNWTPELRHSALVSFAFVLFNTLIGASLYHLADTQWLYDAMNLPRISKEFWVGVPVILKAIIVLLVYDFNVYWMHRILHTSVLWPSHAVHHSDTQLQFLSWSRGHVVEQVILFGGIIFLGSWLGLSIGEIASLGFGRAMHQYYVHSNLDWSHGPLKYIIASPRFHRWHHADVEAAYDKNFASIFPFYDLMFGSYYCPGPARNVPTGFEGSPGDDFVALLFYPFKEWARMIDEAIKSRTGKSTAKQSNIEM